MSLLRIRLAAALLALLAAACGTGPDDAVPDRFDTVAQAVTVPAKGTAATLDVGNWNIEWFGSTSSGPTNESLQLANARDVIAGADLDLWGVAEIVDTAHFNNLKSQLSGYAGFLANDALVTSGASYYSATEQKVGVLYKTSHATLLGARIILTANDTDFAGRPPLEVRLRVSLNGHTEDVVLIVLHMKAFADSDSWERRRSASLALKSYLDSTWPTQKVVVLGDWNDDVDTSIVAGYESPFKNFVDDSLDYRYPTGALSAAGVSSTTSYPDFIDHQLLSNELNAQYEANSVEAYRVDQYIANYDATTSDHFPVLSRYVWGSGGGTPASVTLTAPNGGESWAAGSTQNITWTQSGLSNVALDYSLDDGATWSLITSSTAASALSYAWTVPGVATSSARVRVSDAANAALADASDAAFTITAETTSSANVVLHEILANEPGSNTAGEFVELLNTGGSAQDLSGWTLSDASGVRHTFAAGTSLAAGKALVVFGAASAIPSGLSNAVAASTGSLGLANKQDTVTLKRNDGTVASQYTYASSLASQDGVSMNRSPDGNASGGFVLHNTLVSAASSAGKRANGTAW